MPRNVWAPAFLANGVMSGTNTIYSNVVDLERYDYAGIQVDWTGTPTGTITVWASNDRVTYESLTFSPALTQPSGSASGIGIQLQMLPFRYWMLSYTNASGSGTLNASLFAKDFG